MDQRFIFFPTIDFSSEFYLFYGFCFAVLLQLIYVVFVYARLAFYRYSSQQKQYLFPPLSIVVVVHNQADFIEKNLLILLQQNYPTFEVIVVSNQSSDETKYLLAHYKSVYDHLNYTILEQSRHLSLDKKLPLNLAVKMAKYQHIVLTEVDCCPSSLNYLQEIGKTYATNKSVVLGYAPMNMRSGWLNWLIAHDVAWTAVNYLSFTRSKLPYIGTLRNVSFTKDVFQQWQESESLQSDTDMFIGQIAHARHYAIVVSPHSYMHCSPPFTWKDWIFEKRQYRLTLPKINSFARLATVSYALSLAMMYVTFVALLFVEDLRLISLLIFVFVFCVKWAIHGSCFVKLNERKSALFFPFYDIFYAVIMPIIYYACTPKKR